MSMSSATRLNMSQLSQLPEELQLEIVGYLDHRSLLQCASTCRSLYCVTNAFASVRYPRELELDSMKDNNCQKSLLHFLIRLWRLRESWENLDWEDGPEKRIDMNCIAYELVGGIFSLTDGSGFQSFTLKPGTSLKHKHVQFSVKDFAIDPTQDLVVLMEEKLYPGPVQNTKTVKFHVRTVSSNEKHPLALNETLEIIMEMAEYLEFMTSAVLQVYDDVLGILLPPNERSLHPIIIIWNWKNDILAYDSRQNLTPDVASLVCEFAFINRSTFFLTFKENQGSIRIYTFDPCMPCAVLAPPLVLNFPSLRPLFRIVRLTAHGSPFVSRPPETASFYPSAESNIHVITICYGSLSLIVDGARFLEYYNLFVHTKTLLHLVAAYAPGSILTWERWGERFTRFIPAVVGRQWLRYAHGQKVVCYRDGAKVITVLDFNVSSQAKSDGQNNSRRRLEKEPTTLACNPFKDTVVSNLPYYSTSKDLPDPFFACMIDNERIIGVKGETDEDEVNGILFRTLSL